MSSRVIALLIALLFISGCFGSVTTTTYDKAWTKATSVSSRIYLSYRENSHRPFSMALSHNSDSTKYLLHVYWDNAGNEMIFNGMNTSLKFLVDGTEFIELSPVKYPKTISFNIENKTHTEEGIFSLTYDQINFIANAKTVEVELAGRFITVHAHFNKWSTFKAFKKFLANSHHRY